MDLDDIQSEVALVVGLNSSDPVASPMSSPFQAGTLALQNPEGSIRHSSPPAPPTAPPQLSRNSRRLGAGEAFRVRAFRAFLADDILRHGGAGVAHVGHLHLPRSILVTKKG